MGCEIRGRDLSNDRNSVVYECTASQMSCLKKVALRFALGEEFLGQQWPP